MSLPSAETLQQVVMGGDLSGLTDEQRLQYHNGLAESVGLNPLFSGLQYTKLQGKEVLYATKATAEQLRKKHKISISDIKRDSVGDLLIVTATASMPDGRIDTSTAAIDLSGLKGERLANAIMKAETKAKRRVTLSICGLGILDESEVEGVKIVAEVANVAALPEPKRTGPFLYNFSNIEDAEEKKALQKVAKEWGCKIDRDKKAWVCGQEVAALAAYEMEVSTDEN